MDKTQTLCAWEDCQGDGEFKAPRSKQALRSYQHFCKKHIREFNKSWNYFIGMNDDEVQDYQINAALGHKKTWKMGVHFNMHRMHEQLDQELENLWSHKEEYETHKKIPLNEKQALDVLELSYPLSLQDIKKRYKELAKQHHPDVNDNGGCEESLKAINQAYHTLKKSGNFS